MENFLICLKKFILSKILGKLYYRTGKCNAGGKCCEKIYVKHFNHVIQDEEEFKKKKACQSSLIEQEYSDLKQKYETLNAQYNELLSFKQKIEDKEKDELIGKFFMLSDEDKKDVVENKAKYSLEEIESKLSVICFRKKVNFDLGETSENDNKTETQNITTYSLNDDSSSTPAWIKRVKDTKASNNC